MRRRRIGGFWGVAVGVLLGLSACGAPAPAATPDIDATVQAAVAQTRAVEVAAATLVAATDVARQTATSEAAQAASPTPASVGATPDTPTPSPAPSSTSTSAPTATSTSTAVPTATSTATPAPTPTPTEDRLVIAETAVDGSSGDGRDILVSSSPTNSGRVILLPNFQQAQVRTPMVFGNYVTARVAVFDTRREGRQDGNGIRSVTFDVNTPNGDTYHRVEETAPYCLFGGNDPACPGIDVRQARSDWPDGQYSAAITIEARDGLTSNWNWTFCVHTCNPANPPWIDFAQIGRDSLDPVVYGELVFQVVAYQEEVGTDDGDGIDYVDFYIYGPDDENHQIWHQREQNPPFCAFGGGNVCPGATLDQPGQYRLVAVATADDGLQSRLDYFIDVQATKTTVPD